MFGIGRPFTQKNSYKKGYKFKSELDQAETTFQDPNNKKKGRF